MSRPISPPLADLLVYLDEIGYRDLYLPATPSGGRSPAAAPAPRPNAGAAAAPLETAADATPAPPATPTSSKPLQIVDAEAQSCTRCRLAETRNRVVFGVGDPNAELMLIGEGPGAEEDRRGEPFVGPAGALLDRILAAIELAREEVYIANIVKCRPPGNRDPQADEVEACSSYLEAQIDLVRPRVIVALGRVAAQSLLGTGESLGRLRGRWHRVRGVDTRVTYHPAGLLRNQAWKRPCWEDMQIVRDRLAEG